MRLSGSPFPMTRSHMEILLPSATAHCTLAKRSAAACSVFSYCSSVRIVPRFRTRDCAVIERCSTVRLTAARLAREPHEARCNARRSWVPGKLKTTLEMAGTRNHLRACSRRQAIPSVAAACFALTSITPINSASFVFLRPADFSPRWQAHRSLITVNGPWGFEHAQIDRLRRRHVRQAQAAGA